MAYRGRGGRGGRQQTRQSFPPEVEEEPREQKAQQPQQRAQQVKQRGSWHNRNQNRAQTFRAQTNQKVIQEFATQNLESLKVSLFSEFSSLSDALKTANVEPQSVQVRLSFTVRGIGLTLFESVMRIQAQLPEVDIPVHSLFRVSLLHLAAKYDCTKLSGNIGFEELLVGEWDIVLTSDIRDVVKMNPLNLTPVSGIINSLGRFSLDDVKYFPSFLKPCTPMNFTILDLRDIVVLLANANTPIDVRQKWANYNSIPGAQFENELNPILVNADEIMPADYDLPTIRRDFLVVKAFLAKVGRKLSKLVGSVTFDDKGSPGQLLTTEIHGNSPKIWSFVDFNENNGTYQAHIPPYISGDALQWHSSRKLTTEQAVIGAVTLCGEIQIQMPAEAIIPWVINRSPRCAVSRYSFSRENIISGMIG